MCCRISVIVPVYNVEKYLKECIESILSQTYKDFELILVDDGSTDSSGKICDYYMGKDDRIKVLHKKNGGLSSARNAGINIAVGEYVSFVDSDDYILEDFLKKLYEKSKCSRADICECTFYYLKGRKLIQSRKFDVKELIKTEAIERLFAPPYQSFVNTWNKLYKRALFQEILFPEGKLHEDEFTTYKLLYEANKVAYLNECLYVYRIRNNSITTAKFSTKRADVLQSVGEKRKYFNLCGINIKNELDFHEFAQQISLLNAMVETNTYVDELWNNIRVNILRHRKDLIRNSFLKRGHKIYILLLSNKRYYVLFQKIIVKLRGAFKLTESSF